MKRRFISLFLILMMSVIPLPISAEEDVVNEPVFTDVPESHVAYEAITDLAARGVLNGKSEGMFFPEDTLKREEFAKLLTEALSLTKGENPPLFNDVLAGSWYADYVISAASNGLIYGVSDAHFGVGTEITRQDMAVMLKRYLDSQGIQQQESTTLYADNDAISDYAKDAVALVSALGIMNSRENNLWCPQSPATRAEAAMALYTALDAKRIEAASLGRYGKRVQYGPPYEEITGDRLAESMPAIFDVATWPRAVIAQDDLEDSDYGKLVLEKTREAQVVFEEGIGYESDGCVVVTDKGVASFAYQGMPGEFHPGDFVAFTCMMKGENIEINEKHGYRPIVQVYDDTPQWMAEGNTECLTADSDWVEITNIIQIPQEDNDLDEPDFFTIKLSCNAGETDGTMYFDNLTLSKIQFHPMDVVFMDPVYKGIVKGEGGVGDISLRAFINDCNGLYDFSAMNFTARITDEDHNVLLESTSETVTSVMDAHFSSATLPMGGDFWAECILTDKETGEVVQMQDYQVFKREADFTTDINIDEYHRVVKNGEPMFPITIYNYGGYWDELVYSDAIDSIHQPISLYLDYSVKASQEFVDNLREQDKSLTMVTGCFAYGALYNNEFINWFTKQTDVRAYIKRLTDNFKDLDVLDFYYTWDEVSAIRFGHELEWANELFTHYDLDHPTTCAISDAFEYRPGIYSKTADFIGYDPYAVTGKEDQDLSITYEEIMMAHALNPNRPIEMFPQGFWYGSRGDLRAPYYEEFKNMCFQGIIAGATMFNMYCYGDLLRSATPGRTSDEMWEDYEQVFREIQYLEPIIMSVLPAPYYEVQGGGEWLNSMTKRHDGKSYLFTVNNDKTEHSAKIYLDGVKTIKGMYSQKEYTADANGWFEIEWDVYETEVFEYEQADYKSSHAELRNFVAANYTVFDSGDYGLIEAEIDTPTIVIDDGAAEMEYRAHMSDYAQLYINGEAVPESGKISIEGVDKLDLKVVSEDGRFTTEKTYLLKRE